MHKTDIKVNRFLLFILTETPINALKNILKMCSVCNVTSDSRFDIFFQLKKMYNTQSIDLYTSRSHQLFQYKIAKNEK